MQCSDTTQQMVFKIYTKHLACLVFIYNRLYNICFPCTLSPYCSLCILPNLSFPGKLQRMNTIRALDLLQCT